MESERESQIIKGGKRKPKRHSKVTVSKKLKKNSLVVLLLQCPLPHLYKCLLVETHFYFLNFLPVFYLFVLLQYALRYLPFKSSPLRRFKSMKFTHKSRKSIESTYTTFCYYRYRTHLHHDDDDDDDDDVNAPTKCYPKVQLKLDIAVIAYVLYSFVSLSIPIVYEALKNTTTNCTPS